MDSIFPYEAVILDLDGVITDTRGLHFEAWKETFDEYLQSIEGQRGFEKQDYNHYVDGKPREEGIRSFMKSREMELSDDKLNGIAQKKDSRYLEKLRQIGPKVYQDSVDAIKRWKDEKIPVAVVSSSKNCTEVLERAGIKDLFDAQVDALSAEKSNLRGKPEADYFLEAAKLLGKNPADCAIVEDSVAGIKAGVKGHFKDIIGMSREGQTSPAVLYKEGASLVVDSLENIGLIEHALKDWDELYEKIGDREIALFLDFDGTLSEIVPKPDQAEIRKSILPVLESCSQSIKVTVVSGRDRQDVKNRIKLENLFYAGCHGFDISGPGGFHFDVEEASEMLPQLIVARGDLEAAIKTFDGAIMENKKYFTAIHYRNVLEMYQSELKEKVRSIVDRFDKLAIREGKKVIEVSPAIDWGKGDAIKKLCEVLDINRSDTVPIYLGDDLTDEDAFKEIKGWGIGIKIDDELKTSTAADYWLSSPAEVEQFLKHICRNFAGREKKWRHGK